MARKIKETRLKSINNEVERNPGRKAGCIARRLGLHRSQVTRSLPALEERGLYLFEDEDGRLWPYRKPKGE